MTYPDRPLTLLSSQQLSLLNSRVGADAPVRATEAELDANATHYARTNFVLNSRSGDDAQVRATDAELDAGGITSAKVLAY